MMRNIFVTGLLLGSTLVNMGLASANTEVIPDNEVHDNNENRRSLFLRGSAEENQEHEERELQPGPKEQYGARLKLYQMDTSRSTAAEWSEKEASHEGFSFGTQPFYKPLENGASGELIYRPYGWDFLYTFVARGLPSGAPYTLVYNPNSANPGADIVCLGTNEVGRLGQFFLAGNIPLGTNLPKASDRNYGAKIWLVPASDINCEGSIKSMSSEPNYNLYMFSKENQFLHYDYLG